MHYLDVIKNRYQKENEEQKDYRLEINQIHLLEKSQGKMVFYYLYLTSKDYQMKENEDKKDEDL